MQTARHRLALQVSLLTLLLLITFFAFSLQPIRISGHSMEPTLRDGQWVLVNRAAYGLVLPFVDKCLVQWSRPAAGELVIAWVQGERTVKRCGELSPQGLFLYGDNPAWSLDSRAYGGIPVENVYGNIVWY